MKRTLQERYRMAEAFSRSTIIRARNGKWLLVGPGHNWFDEEFGTHSEALDAALAHEVLRANRIARRRARETS